MTEMHCLPQVIVECSQIAEAQLLLEQCAHDNSDTTYMFYPAGGCWLCPDGGGSVAAERWRSASASTCPATGDPGIPAGPQASVCLGPPQGACHNVVLSHSTCSLLLLCLRAYQRPYWKAGLLPLRASKGRKECMQLGSAQSPVQFAVKKYSSLATHDCSSGMGHAW